MTADPASARAGPQPGPRTRAHDRGGCACGRAARRHGGQGGRRPGGRRRDAVRARRRADGRHGGHRRGREGRGADALQRRTDRRGSAPEVDVAVDPLEGTTLTAKGQPNALCGDALSERNSMSIPGRACTWRRSLRQRGHRRPGWTSTGRSGERPALVAERRGKDIRDVMVVMLDREAQRGRRWKDVGATTARASGSIPDGDDESAFAARCRRQLAGRRDVRHRRHARGCHLGGGDEAPRRRLRGAAVAARRGRARGRGRAGLRPRPASSTRERWVKGNDCFFAATGVTDGDVLQGVRYPTPRAATTESLVMRSRTHTVRRIQARHNREKLRAYNAGLYG